MHRWKLSALAAAAFVSAALSSTDAAALALGPISVHSSLGEPLRADIAIPQITPAEMDSLLATIASPEVFRAQGMDYSAAARTIAVELKRHADGTAQLHLSSHSPITDPFLDLVLQTQWHSGHLVRSYTLLLDPPAATRTAMNTIAPAQVAPAAPPAAPSAAITGRTYSSSGATSPAPATRPAPAAPTPAAVATPTAAPASVDSVTIRTGQTAGQIAQAHRAPGVSLDQMLVALLRSNPDAFINGNVNRIRAGTVVQMPSREQALETSAPEARRIVAAQSRDFNAYRRSLAAKAPTAAVQAADRSSSGQVQAHVEDASPAAATSDKLTLSKTAATDTAAAEQHLADQKQAQDQNDRLSELQRNLTELNQLTQSAAPASSTAAVAAALETPASPAPEAEPAVSASALPLSLEVSAPTLPPVAAEATQDTPVSAEDTAPPTGEASPETTAAEPAAPVAPPASAPSPSFIPAPAAPPTLWEQLRDNPLIPAGTAALALLLGLLGYRAWKKRTHANAEQDPALDDSQLQSDSFFGGSGGQQVDTNSAEGATTMAYSASQLDGGADVDPVAEADVYLAYGRDVQAEEILKEALRTYPQRLAIHMKLAEIYAKRQDLQAFEHTARTMQDLSAGEGADWQRVLVMGRSLDPSNPLYASAALPEATRQSSTSFADALHNAQPLSAPAAIAAVTAATAAALPQDLPDLDLNLDIDLPGGLADQQALHSATDLPSAIASPPSDEAFAALEPQHNLDAMLDLSALPTEDPPTLVADTVMPDEASADSSSADGLDFDLSSFQMQEPAQAATPAVEVAAPTQHDTPTATNADALDMGVDLHFDSTPAPIEVPTATDTSAPAPSGEMGLDFDLSALELGPDSLESTATDAQSGQNAAQDALTTKLDLAQEFNAIGDSEGARALIEEVLAEASGAQKARAQKMLSDID